MGYYYCMKQQRRCINAQRICGLSTGQTRTGETFSSSEYCKSGHKQISEGGFPYYHMCEWFFVVQDKPVE